MIKWNGILCLSALMTVSSVPLAGCGGDDDSSGSGGKGGAKSGSSGSGTDVAGTGGSAGAAGSNSINDLINMFTTPMCDPNATNVDSCGDESCPAPASGGLLGCMVSCCTSDNHCGARYADSRITQIVGSTCTVPGKSDARCPSMSLPGMSLPGCCDSSNHCGQLFGGMCVAGGLGGFGGAAPAAVSCDAANGGDAGVESDAGR